MRLRERVRQARHAVLLAAAVFCALVPPVHAAEIDDAFQPQAMRAGSFDLLPYIGLRGGYTDNVARTAGARQSSALTSLGAGLDAISDWSRHEARGAISGDYTAHAAGSAYDDADLQASLALRLDVLVNDAVLFDAGYGLTREDRVDDQAASVGLGYLHRLNRLSLRPGLRIDEYSYGTRQVSLGSAARDNVADYRQYTAALRLAYLLPSEAEAFVEPSANTRRFTRSVGSDGLEQGSDGFGLLAGIGYNNGSKLRGATALGYRVQRPDDARLDSIDAVIFSADLTWDVTALTSMQFAASSDIGETTIPGTAGYVAHRGEIELTHALRRHVLLGAGLAYERIRFEGVDLTEQSIEASLGAEYRIGRHVALTGDLAFLAFDSSAAGSDYHATTIMLGVEARP